jgi:hypothetical protein
MDKASSMTDYDGIQELIASENAMVVLAWMRSFPTE